MNGHLRRFARKQVRRVRALAAPLALAVALVMVALTRLPSANTLWYEELSLTAAVSTGSFGCQPLAVTGSSPVESGGKTTFGYTLTGGGAVPGCKNLSYLAIPVCFNPDLGGGVVVSADPGARATPMAYDPKDKDGERLVKWSAVGSPGSGPFHLVFSITVQGTGLRLETVETRVHAGSGHAWQDGGPVQVPACPSNGSSPSGSSSPRGGSSSSSGTSGTPSITGSSGATPVTPTATRTPNSYPPASDPAPSATTKPITVPTSEPPPTVKPGTIGVWSD